MRRPDERNLSAFFQNASKYGITPNTDEKEAFRIFIEKYSHHIPNRWFDDEIKKYFGLDVYKEKFCRESKFIGGQGKPLLLLGVKVVKIFGVFHLSFIILVGAK